EVFILLCKIQKFLSILSFFVQQRHLVGTLSYDNIRLPQVVNPSQTAWVEGAGVETQKVCLRSQTFPALQDWNDDPG
ncbi:hypothetical protein STEG23_036089, partial [Scotinomys teguina]